MYFPIDKRIVLATVAISTQAFGSVPTAAQAVTPTRRQIAQQRQTILQQQRQIRDYQRQLAAQPRQAQQEETGLSSLFCPRGYTATLLSNRCYPILPTPVVIVPPPR